MNHGLPASFRPLLSKGNDMALIADIASIGTALGTLFFAAWMFKQLVSDKS